MKMYLGGVPVKTMKVNHFEMDTNSADVQPSDMQAGITCFARGRKIVGTGKCFEFATYGSIYTNVPTPVTSDINVVEIASLDYPVQLSMALNIMKNTDFSTPRNVANIIINGQSYPLTVVVTNGKMTISCDKTIKLQIFYGRDNYV